MRDEMCDLQPVGLDFHVEPFNFQVRRALEIRLKVGALLEIFSPFFSTSID